MQPNISSICVRLAEPPDANTIELVVYEAFIEHAPAYTPVAFAATTPTAAQIRSRLNEGPIWVAMRKNVILGTVSAVPKGEGVYMRSMAVLPIARGHGIGVVLIQHVERFAAVNGYRYVFLSTTPFLTRAIQLYERLGFRRSDDGPHELFGTPLFTMVKLVDDTQVGA